MPFRMSAYRNVSGEHLFKTSNGSTTFPIDLDIFCPSAAVTKPCANTAFGKAMLQLINMHGQMTQWNQMISFPMMCTFAGQNFE